MIEAPTTETATAEELIAESSVTPEPAAGSAPGDSAADWPLLPTETEIYILPDGRVVIADLPAELSPLAAALGAVEAGEIAPHAEPDPAL